jgi:addiction module RelB/DinJ family antitoxin
MANKTTLNLRVDPKVKQHAEEILSELGISMSAAITMYLKQINMTGGIPFPLEIPKAPVEINAELMTEKELRDKLQKGYEDMKAGRVAEASEVFELIKEKHSI